jgi:hypothetical protein
MEMMLMRRGRPAAEFRASLGIRLTVLSALLLWVVVGLAGAIFDALPAQAFASIGFFVLFFSGFVAYYWSMAYVVDEYGVTYRGATEFIHFPWEEIENVRDSDLPLGGYYVTTKAGGFVLNKFVRGRDELRDLIIARAGLFPVVS